MPNFKPILYFILVLLFSTFLYQAYWVRTYYHEQSSKLELDILSAMRSANDQLIFQKGNLVDVGDLKSNDFYIYNDLLQGELMQRSLNFESILEIVDIKQDKILVSIPDNVAKKEISAHKEYSYVFDLNQTYAYRLYVSQIDRFLLKQMSGILLTSFLMMIALVLSYIYLLKVIHRQKTLDDIKTDFVNNMTHELKTPISVAYAATDALLNYGFLDDVEKRIIYLNASQKQLKHLSGLVEQILTMSVENRKNMKLELSEVNLSEVFRQLKEEYMLSSLKEVEIEIDVTPENLSIKADKVHFRNVLNNLVENAIKYSGEKASVFLKAVKKDNQVIIEVKDHGIGIPQASLPKLFDRFYRVPTGDIHNIKGYGLGLYYVKMIVEKHFWKIQVKSKEGEGTSFLIQIGGNRA